jgi:molybdate transport system substrate-binding protein
MANFCHYKDFQYVAGDSIMMKMVVSIEYIYLKLKRSYSMNQLRSMLAIIVVLLTMVCNSDLQAAELRVSVAASMTEVFKDLIADFSKLHPDVTILPNFGPSGGLAKQINQGAPADLYVSANPKWMEFLIEQKQINLATKTTFAHNSLVFVGHRAEHISSLDDLPNLQRIGIGSPKSVPAGQYAQQALLNTGIYDQLLAAGKLVMAKDVRQALIYADRGETDGSFVYKTDALLATRAVILFDVPQDLYDRVTYPLALTIEGVDKPYAQAFYKYIGSSDAAEIVKKYGFTIPE